MNPRQWYKKSSLKLLGLAIIELVSHAALLGGFGLMLHDLKAIEQPRTLSLMALLMIVHLVLRCKNAWTPQTRWKLGFKNNVNEARFWIDLAQSKGTDSKEEFWERAREEQTLQASPSWTPSVLLSNGLFTLCSSAVLISLMWASDAIELPQTKNDQLQIQITPPPHVGLPQREAHPLEQELQLFAGSLIEWSSSQEINLQDQEQRQYISTMSASHQHQVRARVMQNQRFAIDDDLSWQVSILEDQKPTVKWIQTPRKTTSLRPVSLSFSARDDFGLEETLISVNGRELEYAGRPAGETTLNYRWNFDPNDHINLMGGNIVLRIVAYDNDRVGGPKSGESSPLIWEFPGVGALADDSLKELQQLMDRSEERLESSTKTRPSDVLRKMIDLAHSLRKNPAVPPQIQSMLQTMAQQYQRATRQNPKKLSKSEEEQLQRNRPLLQHLESMLQQISQMVKSANMLKQISQLSDDLRVQKDKPEQFQDLYNNLEEQLQASSLPKGAMDHLLKQVSQAELSALMGDKEAAAQQLDETAELLRQLSSSPQSGNSEIAAMFEQLMKDLDQLIQGQMTLQSLAALTPPSSSKPVQQQAQALRKKLREQQAYQTYQQTLKKLKQPGQSPSQQQAWVRELKDPNTAAFAGSEMQRLDQQLSQIATGKTPQMPLEHFKKNKAFKSNDALKADLEQLEQTIKASQADWASSSNLVRDQTELSTFAKAFSSSFKLNFEPMLPAPALFSLAKKAALNSQKAVSELKQGQPSAVTSMQQSSMGWLKLKDQLQQMSNPNQGQGQSQGNGMPQLTLDANGELQLQPSTGQEQGVDGEWSEQQQELDIALPEDFKNPRDIEKQLKESLQSAPNQEQKESFQQYMIDLLE